MALLTAFVRADTISTFEVSGTASGSSGQSCGSNCLFSGTLTADVTMNVLNAVEITFPGLAPFNSNFGFRSTGTPVLELVVHNGAPQCCVGHVFHHDAKPGTLLGLTGGTIIGGGVFGPSAYAIQSGSITPIPEPGALFLLAPALLAALAFGRKQIFRPSAK